MYNLLFHTDSNTVIEVDVYNTKLKVCNNTGTLPHTTEKEDTTEALNYTSAKSATCSTAEESGSEMSVANTTTGQKRKAFGQVKTLRYSHHEKPPLPKIKFRWKKGTVKALDLAKNRQPTEAS